MIADPVLLEKMCLTVKHFCRAVNILDISEIAVTAKGLAVGEKHFMKLMMMMMMMMNE